MRKRSIRGKTDSFDTVNVLTEFGLNTPARIVHQTISESGVLIHIIEFDEKPHVIIEVSQDITQRQLRDAIGLACKWRDTFLPKGPRTVERQYLQALMSAKEHMTYAQLAELINKDVSALLYLHHTYPTWPVPTRLILATMRLTDSEIDQALQDGLRSIEAGKPPFSKGYPINPDKIRKTLTWYRAKTRIGKRP